MRTSRTVSQIKQIDKTVYPKCNIKKEHQKESLNLVCITKNCKFSGPICTLCKKDHVGHNIVPIKLFVTNISQYHKKATLNNQKIQQKLQIQQKPISKNPFQKLQQQFHQIMGMLHIQVVQLSQQIRKTQQKLLQEFQQIKVSLNQQVHYFYQHMNQKVQKTINHVISNCISKQQTYRRYFLVQKKHSQNTQICQLEFQKYFSIINLDEVVPQNNQSKIIKNYQNKAEIYKENLFNISNQIKEFYSLVYEKNMIDKVQKIPDVRPKTAMPGSIKNQNLTFSNTLKAPNITIEKDGKIAKLKDNNGNKIIFFSNGISSKNYQTTIKIVNLLGNISIGIGLKDKIKQKGYKFDKSTPMHGVYMIVSNTFKYNSSQKTEDGLSNSFAFGNQDQIHILLKTKQKKVIFSVKNDPKKITELSLKSLGDNSFKQLQFCACFTAMGDKIQIL